MITFTQLFEHFEGKDWVTFVASLIAIVVSCWAVAHNRRANYMKEVAGPAQFTATWHEHEDDRPIHVLRLVNCGDGQAERVMVTMPFDPNHILGLDGIVPGPVKPTEGAMFHLSRTPEFKTQSYLDKYNLVVEWFDTWGKPRSQRIWARNVRWGEMTSIAALDHHPDQVNESAGLYDLVPWFFRVFNSPSWKRRRKNRPRQDFR